MSKKRRTLFLTLAIIVLMFVSACGLSLGKETKTPIDIPSIETNHTGSTGNSGKVTVTEMPPDNFPRTPNPVSITVTLDTKRTVKESNVGFPFIVEGKAADGSEFYMSMNNKLYFLDANDNLTNAFGTVVSMTPVSAIEGLPFSQGFLTAVQLDPEGLVMAEPGSLQLTVPGKYDVTELIGFAADGTGGDFHLYPVTASYMDYNDTTNFYINVVHFSIYGIAKVLPGEIEAQQAHPPASSFNQDEDELAPLVIIKPDTYELTPLIGEIQLQLLKSHTRLVKPLLDSLATTKCEQVSVAAYRFNEWQSKVDRANQTEYFQQQITSDANALHTRFNECAKDLCPVCMGSQSGSKPDMARLNSMITLATFAEVLSFNQGFDDFAYWSAIGSKCSESGGLPNPAGSTGGDYSGDATLPTPTPVGCPVP